MPGKLAAKGNNRRAFILPTDVFSFIIKKIPITGIIKAIK